MESVIRQLRLLQNNMYIQSPGGIINSIGNKRGRKRKRNKSNHIL